MGAGPAKTRRAGGDPASEFSIASTPGDGPHGPATAGIGPAGAIGTIDALLALQTVDGPGGEQDASHRRALATAEAILDRLEDLRRHLLLGAIPADRLSALSELIARDRGDVTDPVLGDLLDEIDLRAQVELAKQGR